MGFWQNKGSKPPVNRVKKVEILIFGAEPPCSRCFLAERNAREAAAEFPEGLVTVDKVDAWSEKARKYRITMTPTTVINGDKAAVGRVLDREEIKAIIRGLVGDPHV
jgi:predicted DsbA family dithiol-disulfide isomerase